MNFTAFTFILVVITNLTCALYLLLKPKNTKLKTIWGLFCIFVALWGFGGWKFSTTLDYEKSFFWWKIAYICGICAPTVFAHFTFTFLNIKRKTLLIVAYSIAVCLTLTNIFAGELFLGDIRLIFNEFYWHDWSVKKNILFTFYVIFNYWGILSYIYYLLIKHMLNSTGARKNQIKYFLVGTFFGWLGPHGMFFIDFGLITTYPYTNLCVAIYPFFIAYAIIRHQLLDINIVIKKSLIYSLLLTFTFLVYLITIFLLEHLVQTIFHYESTLIRILTAFILGLLIIPLRNKIQRITDNILFKATPIEMSEQNDRLRQEVAQSEKLKAIATLASGMAHEIKNPLTAIKTFTEHLPSKKKDDEFLDKFAKIVGKEVHRVDELVQQLLEFARPAPLLLKDVDIHSLLKETLDFLNNKLIEQHIHLKTDFDENKPLIINADSNQLKQAFLNLLLNAIDAMPDGGTLTIGVRVQGLGDRETAKTNKPKSLHPTPYTLHPKIIISITDTGCGIDKESQKHIFEPFYSNKDHGTGLGLSITYGIIQEHGGLITLESKLKEGTSFFISLALKGDLK